MASMSVCFSPKALARPNTQSPRRSANKKSFRNPNLNPKFKRQISRYKPPPEPVVLPGGEATTYTRLPPKDDYEYFAPSSEVKLSESTPATLKDEADELIGEEEEDEDVDDEVVYDNLGGNYEKFEIFEGKGGSDFEDEEEEEDDNDENLGFMDGVTASISGRDEGGELSEFQNGEYVDFSDDGEDIFEGGAIKEKGVPAVMRCFDRAKIYVKAGDGGNGVVAFRREKFVPLGGPSGGDGGRGGNVYIEVDGSMNSLLPFRNSVHFRAGRGSHGLGKMQSGAKGEDVVVKVAPGTVIREAGQDEVLLELLYPGQRALTLPGGRGGRGNASFKTGTNKVPRIAENGEEGPEM